MLNGSHDLVCIGFKVTDVIILLRKGDLHCANLQLCLQQYFIYIVLSIMKKAGLALVIIVTLFSCKDKNSPDVSGIDVNLKLERFEQDFFALDTNNTMNSLVNLDNKYPNFLGDFLQNILELPPFSDT